MGALLALAGTALYATTNVLVRRASRRGWVGDGYLLTVAFNAVAVALALAWVAAAGGLPPLAPAGLLAFAGAGLTTTFLGRRLLFASLALIGPARSLPFKVTAPIFTVLLACLFLGEPLSGALLVGIAAVAAGLWLLSRDRVEQSLRHTAVTVARHPEGAEPSSAPAGPAGRPPTPARLWSDPVTRRGAALALLSGASFGVGHFLRKVGLLGVPSELVGIAVGAWVALGAGWLLRMVEGPPPSPPGRSGLRRVAPWEFWAGGLFTTLGLLLQFTALRHMPVSTASVIFASEPLLSLGVGLFLLNDELPTWRAALSAVLVFGGIAVVVSS